MTPRERQAFDFIKSFSTEKRYPPSYDEIADAIGVKSRSHVHQIVVNLERQRKIRRNLSGAGGPGKRCIEIIDWEHDDITPWKQVGEAADKVLNSIKREYINDRGQGAVLVDAEALGALDVALAEARPHKAGAAS